jgi:putative transcriptional regulator
LKTNILQKGKLLIAEPSILNDNWFNRSVLLLVDHNDKGSVGFILNKPLEYTINDAVPEIEANFPIYNGGPVDQDSLYFIHTCPHLISDSEMIADELYWGGDVNTVTQLINDGTLLASEIRFFLGYSGWERDQLEGEIKANTWVVRKNSFKADLILQHDGSFWKKEMLKLGGDYQIWANAPDNPSNN